MGRYISTKIIELGSCAFRQPRANSHCKFLHGYRLTAKFWFQCNSLDNNNWVVDFGSLKNLKEKLQDTFDHTTCIDKNDPFLVKFQDLAREEVCRLVVMDGVGIEKFAEHCFNVANKHIKEMTQDRCWVEKVEVFEHENNSAMYESVQDLRHSEYMAAMDDVSEDLEDNQPPVVVKHTDNKPAHSGSSSVTSGLQDPPRPADQLRTVTPANTKPSSLTDDPAKHNWNFGTKWI